MKKFFKTLTITVGKFFRLEFKKCNCSSSKNKNKCPVHNVETEEEDDE